MSDDGPKEAPIPGAIEATRCLGLATRQLSRAVSRHFDEALRPAGLLNSQFSVLVALAVGGDATIGSLAGRLDLDRTTLTRNVRVLVDRGLVALDRDGRDRRTRVARLTNGGQQAMREALPLWREADEELRSLVGADDLAALAERGARVRDALRAARD